MASSDEKQDPESDVAPLPSNPSFRFDQNDSQQSLLSRNGSGQPLSLPVLCLSISFVSALLPFFFYSFGCVGFRVFAFFFVYLLSVLV